MVIRFVVVLMITGLVGCAQPMNGDLEVAVDEHTGQIKYVRVTMVEGESVIVSHLFGKAQKAIIFDENGDQWLFNRVGVQIPVSEEEYLKYEYQDPDPDEVWQTFVRSHQENRVKRAFTKAGSWLGDRAVSIIRKWESLPKKTPAVEQVTASEAAHFEDSDIP